MSASGSCFHCSPVCLLYFKTAELSSLLGLGVLLEASGVRRCLWSVPPIMFQGSHIAESWSKPIALAGLHGVGCDGSGLGVLGVAVVTPPTALLDFGLTMIVCRRILICLMSLRGASGGARPSPQEAKCRIYLLKQTHPCHIQHVLHASMCASPVSFLQTRPGDCWVEFETGQPHLLAGI